MKKIFITLAIITSGVFFPVFAGPEDCPPADSTSPADFIVGCASSTVAVPVNGGGGPTATKELVIKVAEQVIAFGSLLAIGAIVYAGIQYTVSGGDDEKLKKAKMTGIYGLIGLVLLLVSFSLVNLIVGFIYRYLGTQ